MPIPLTGMSDEVGVEPERLAKLASALETLRGFGGEPNVTAADHVRRREGQVGV
jgi:hypothetical protein